MAPANSAPTPAPSTAHRACSTRSGRTVVRRGLGALAALIVLAVVGPAALTIPAGAQTTTPPGVAEADAEVARLRAQADELSAKYFAALADLSGVQRRIDDDEARIPVLDAERQRLQELARERAATAYQRSGADLGLLFGARGPLDAARRTQLLNQLNARDATVVQSLRDATRALQAERDQLRAARVQADAALATVKEQGAQIDQLLSDAQARRADAIAAVTTTTPPTTAGRTTTTVRPTGTTAPAGPPVAPPGYVPTPGVHPHHDEPFLMCTRTREASGNYGAVNPAGPYLGAYQFLQSTWNSVANHAGRTDLIAVPPNAASPYDQDDLAWAEFQWQGAGPWGGLCADA